MAAGIELRPRLTALPGQRNLLDSLHVLGAQAIDRHLPASAGCTGCRRRTTPPSVRFLGRKVYLGVVVVLVTALEHGLTARRRRQLIEALDLWPQTLARWRRWWRECFPASRCWRAERGRFIPPVAEAELPGALLGRLSGATGCERVCQLLALIAPLTTSSWAGCLPGGLGTQKM